jgi:hypothetical protein
VDKRLTYQNILFMGKHIVLQILNDLDINSEDNVEKRLQDLDEQTALFLLDKMESWYNLHQLDFLKKSDNSLFDIWIPTTPKEGIDSLSSNMLLADTITLSDPLFDLLGTWINISENEYFTIERHNCKKCGQYIKSKYQDHIRARLSSILAFYKKSEFLIDSGKLNPFINLELSSLYLSPEIPRIFLKYDDELKLFANNIIKTRKKLTKELGRTHLIDMPYYEISKFIDFEMNIISAYTGLCDIFSVKNVLAPSIDFMGSISGNILNAFLKFVNKHSQNKSSYKFPISKRKDYFDLPTLSGLPIQSIPELILKEEDAFEQLKSSIKLKVSKLSGQFGTIEWQMQLNNIRNEMQHDLIELSRTLKHLQNDHIKKQTMEISLLAFSISLASLALSNDIINPMSAIQTVAGGAGIASSLKGILETWLEYRKDVDEQKRKDLYFLWILNKHYK